jgi:DNA-binding NtrC family response regulator
MNEPRPARPRVLIVEDDESSRTALAKLVEREGFSVASAAALAEARELLKQDSPGLVLTDIHLPDGNGIELLRELRESQSTEVVLITGHATVETAVEALRLGASDYVTKPIDLPHLKRVLGNILRTLRLRGEIGMLRDELRSLGRFGKLIGISPPMQKVYDMLSRVGPTEATVLLTGESGTGKEVAAVTLHELSSRRDKPFLAVNCGAVAANMIESELFGHERGSFTGAVQKHTGYFERATGGTLFLDEITEMQAELQVKLLRVLESRKLVRIGGEKEIPVDVRVIAASNRQPEAAVAEGKLREDLFYRLKVFQVHLPPLRERGEDITLLAEHFLRTLNQEAGTQKTFTPRALDRLTGWPWPGNVRELKNVVQAAFILADSQIGPECIPLGASGLGDEPVEAVRPPPASVEDAPQGPEVRLPVGTAAAEAERRLILATLDYCEGNKNKAAKMLGVSLKTMYNRLKSYQEAPS